ncbi:hypothetical protein FEP94_04140 [Burkholderia pseudomultivorans]|nr:hypothetical protein [Burkholderia pseudomultivorans]TCT26571.1 hypothetical protein EC918_12116 [Burkholderia vietnamiensis]MDR8743637.1 hypothetical protein [Burkholderia pseudomultivorans]MDR8780175.1 hypothetical protein [Burkholderia pseudomultivorans]MDR8869415.1 hypothetical protein [Burkholderia pseudomultivorans]
MNVETSLEANAQFAEAGKPGVRALDHPAMPSQPFLAFYSAPGNARRDPSLFQVLPAAGKVVALVRMQFVRAFAGLAAQARYRRYRINRALECHRIMPVGAGDRDRQGNAPGVYDEVSLRPELATVRWVGAGFLAPRGLATLSASTLARPQSIWSCSRNRRSIARCSLSHTPAACQSRKRRQQVMPLPKPSSCGRSSQGIPVCRTYRMPFSAARSPTARRRPPLGDGVNIGINDSSATHNSLLIFRLDMPPGYGVHGWMSRLC